MSKVFVFAGTTEGYAIADYLTAQEIPAFVCVATAYGAERIHRSITTQVSFERMDAEEIAVLMQREGATHVIDATHPYAVVVSQNIRLACTKCGLVYKRLLRESIALTEDAAITYVDSVEAAVAFLETTSGRIFVTTGSKELKKFTRLKDYKERIYARVLSLPSVAQECADLGIEGSHLFCMQGPFSKDMNVAMLRHTQADFLVTKESGVQGGFLEKVDAALQEQCRLVIIGRPSAETGMDLYECRQYLAQEFRIKPKQQVALVGIGMGAPGTLTADAREALDAADLVIGARRLVQAVARQGQPVLYEYRAEAIHEFLEQHAAYEKIAIALSGDVGFYSGALKLEQVLSAQVTRIPGISSVVFFMAKLHKAWENVRIVSLHGKQVNILHEILSNEKVFAILGTADAAAQIAGKLLEYGRSEGITMYLGERLSYPDEKIMTGSPEEFVHYTGDALSVLYVENCACGPQIIPHGIADRHFIRLKAPMTKEEVRAVSLSKLQLTKDAVCYDVGAGTGSVSVEMALQACDGAVFAIEKKEDAVEAITLNKRKFAVDNLTVVEGMAPEALESLPAPTHAFLGGTTGESEAIIRLLLAKNPAVRIVVNAITLETVSEILKAIKEFALTDVDVVQISAAKAKEIGRYHMMMGENPIYIISCRGGGQNEHS
ncbi:MAG: precorrin-6A reductase [Lachnospiraceae bacterium]